MTVFALLALRVVLQAALLREEHDPGTGAPVLCPNCDLIVADMAFCPNCGIATNASSRSSRAARASSTAAMSFAGSGVREVSPTVDRRNDGVVGLKNEIVELGAGDGAQKVKLFGRIGSGQEVQRPVPDRRAPQVRMVKTDPV